MWPYVENALGFLLSSQRGRDAKLFHKGPAFAQLNQPNLKVTSPECGASNSKLSYHHGADSGNQFPALSWQFHKGERPEEGKVKEYLLIVEDPDAPLPSPITHGIYYNIPADTRGVNSASFARAAEDRPDIVKGGFRYGQNRMRSIYGGPRPVLGHGPHRYFYQIIALSEELESHSFAMEKPTKEELAKAIEGKVIAWGLWVGTFERKL